MIQEKPVLPWVLESGVVCGLYTVSEAVLNAEMHCSQFLCYEDIPGFLRALHEEQDAWFASGKEDKIPQDIIDKEIAEMEEYFKTQVTP